MDDFQYVRTLRGAIYGKVALVQHRRSGAFYALKMMSIAHMSARRAIAGARVCEDGDTELRVLRRLSGNCIFRGSELVATEQSARHPFYQEQSVMDTTAMTWSVRPEWQTHGQQQCPRNTSPFGAATLHPLDRHHNNLLLLHKDFVDARTNARCLVFDYCPYGELYDHVQAAPGRALSLETARRFFQQIARAVRFIHTRNVAHRDISLENVLVDAQHACRLADFGLASEYGAACAGKVGKAFYMAPEVLASAPHEYYNGLTADIWSLGVLLFIMVTGAPPFESATESDARFRVVKTQGVAALLRIWQMEKRVSDDLCDLLALMLRVDVHARVSIDKVWCHPWVHDSIDVEALALESSLGADTVAITSPLSLSSEFDQQQQQITNVRGNRDSDAFVAPSPLFYGASTSDGTTGRALDATFAPALAHERSPWSLINSQQDVSALFAPHSTPTAGPRVHAFDGRKVTLRSLCFTSRSSQVASQTRSCSKSHHTSRGIGSDDKGDDDAELKYDTSDRKRRTSLSVSRAMLNQAIRSESGHVPVQIDRRRIPTCRVCQHELESEQGGVAPVKAAAAAGATPDGQPHEHTTPTLCMCASCFNALPPTAQASSVLVLPKAGASVQPRPPAQVA